MQQAHSIQDSKFSYLVSVHAEKQRFGDVSFSGGKMTLIGLFFLAVGSPGLKTSADIN